MSVSSDGSSGSSHRGMILRMLALLAVIAVSNYALLEWFVSTGRRDLWQVALYFGVFILEVGGVSFFAGRFIPGALGWVAFGWSLLLVDLLTFCMTVAYVGHIEWNASGPMLASALVSGQLGAIVV